MKTPLNGTLTHPLSDHAWHVLESLSRSDMRAHEVNAGVINRFMREELCTIECTPTARLVRITLEGRRRLLSGKR